MAAHGYWVQDISDNSVEKSKVKLTSERPEDTILVEGQSGRGWRGGGWAAVERIFKSLKSRSHERRLLILFPATTSLEAISLIWLSCSCLGQVAVFPSCMLRWKKIQFAQFSIHDRKKKKRSNYFVFSFFLFCFFSSFLETLPILFYLYILCIDE